MAISIDPTGSRKVRAQATQNEFWEADTRAASSSFGEDDQCSSLFEEDVFHVDYAKLPSWDVRRFELKFRLSAGRTGNEVELHVDLLTGQVVCVKRMPLSQEAFAEMDVALAQLQMSGKWEQKIDDRCAHHVEAISRVSNFMCASLGAFKSPTSAGVCLVSEYIRGGDLFDVAMSMGNIGPEREKLAWPYIRSVIDATLAFHEAGISHGDLSVENVLLRPGSNDVVLIDFETISFAQVAAGTRGKPSYQAPEMHYGHFYSARDAELFALGVVIYVVAIGSFPWVSTRPNQCKHFAYFCHRGLEGLLMKKTVKENGIVIGRAWNLLSYELRLLLTRLLSPNPSERSSGLAAYTADGHASAPA